MSPTTDEGRGPLSTWLNRRVDTALRFSAHNPLLGAARSLIALGTLVALVATPLEHLFFVSETRPDGRVCSGVAGSIGAFCVVPAEYLGLARWGAVLVLALVVIGFVPRLTAIPHWWVSFSFFSSSNVMEGGDQIAAVLTLLLLPVCLTDPRLWHWQVDTRALDRPVGVRVINSLALLLIWVQVCVVYFHASLGKLVVPSWKDGTSLWYWAMYSPFGAPDHLRGLLEVILASGPVVVAMTWGAVLIEFFIACCLFAAHRLRHLALVLGVGLHTAIALTLGLPGFSIIMFGILVLYAVRPGDPLPRWVSTRLMAPTRRSEKSVSRPAVPVGDHGDASIPTVDRKARA